MSALWGRYWEPPRIAISSVAKAHPTKAPGTATATRGSADGLDLFIGDGIVATSTDALGNTSEFSPYATLVGPRTLVVNDTGDEADAGSPPHAFLQLLLCYRSLAELRAFFPDVWAKPEAALLLDTLFPKLPSVVHPLSNV